MAEEENKVEPVFQGIDDTGMDFQYEEDVNKLKGWFYGNSLASIGGSIGSGSGSGSIDEIKPDIQGIGDTLSGMGENLGEVKRILEEMTKKNVTYVGVVNKDPTTIEDGEQLILIEDQEGNENLSKKLVPQLNMIVDYGEREFMYRYKNGKLGWHEIGEENWESGGGVTWS